MTEWRIDPLGPNHDRSEFMCGVPALDDFIHERITQYEKRGLGRSFVITEQSAPLVIGFYTLAAGSIQIENLPPEVSRRLPRHPVPVVRLARLAVDQWYQKNGIGARLLKDAVRRAFAVAHQIGAFTIRVDAVDEKAASFYRKYGSEPNPSKPLELYLLVSPITS